MSEKGGGTIMILGLFSLLWLLGSAPAKVEPPPKPMPVDGLIEQVATVKESLTVEPPSKFGHVAVVKESLTTQLSDNPGELNHVADAKKMDASPSDRHEKSKREIIIFTRPNCPPCDQWKRCEQSKFESDGWVVAYCEQHDFALTPHFSIEVRGKQYDHKGYLPFSKIDEVTR